MRLFLDTSVLLAACGSADGASGVIARIASRQAWQLIVTTYVVNEAERNLPDMSAAAFQRWQVLLPTLAVLSNVLTLDRPAVFGPSKDRPVLFAALAYADVLLTLDQADFGSLSGSTFYGLDVLRPGTFLARERRAGRLIV